MKSACRASLHGVRSASLVGVRVALCTARAARALLRAVGQRGFWRLVDGCEQGRSPVVLVAAGDCLGSWTCHSPNRGNVETSASAGQPCVWCASSVRDSLTVSCAGVC